MPGRGAYLCRAGAAHAAGRVDPACLDRASRRGGIARALRAAVTLDPKLVESPEGGGAERNQAGLAPLLSMEPS